MYKCSEVVRFLLASQYISEIRKSICAHPVHTYIYLFVISMGEKRNAYRILVGKLEGKRPLGRPRRRWEDNIRMDLREIGWGGMD
jgi:hypothetical protein